jgi:hypothetical protein
VNASVRRTHIPPVVEYNMDRVASPQRSILSERTSVEQSRPFKLGTTQLANLSPIFAITSPISLDGRQSRHEGFLKQ